MKLHYVVVANKAAGFQEVRLYFVLTGRLSLCVSTGCMDVLLIRMCRAYNLINNTLLFDGKFATPQLFKALGELLMNPIQRGRTVDQRLRVLTTTAFFSHFLQAATTW